MENHNTCKHIIAEINTKWRTYPITKIAPKSLSNILEMDHVINRAIAVALTMNDKPNISWQNVKLAYPFKNKCIERIRELQINQGEIIFD